MSWKIIVCIVLVIVAAAAGFMADKITLMPKTTVDTAAKPSADTTAKPVLAIKKYAALQFGVEESTVKIISSSQHNWNDICLGMKIKDYDCKKSDISGYEVTVNAGGYETKYRSNDDGSIIRVVK